MSETPPNLRLSQGEQHCGDCSYAGGNGTVCLMFGNYPVEPNLVCDKWTQAPMESDSTSGEQSTEE